jgi:hypothetical protein
LKHRKTRRVARVITGLAAVASATTLLAPPAVASPGDIPKSNSTFYMVLNKAEGGYQFPVMSELSVDGISAVSQANANVSNAGAALQMTARGYDSSGNYLGDAYNPTQGGTCPYNGAASVASSLVASNYDWTGVTGISAVNGAQLQVSPKLYLEAGHTSCTAYNASTFQSPYQFNFGVTLGNGSVLPNNVALLEQALYMPPGSAASVPPIAKGGCELPAAFFTTANFPFAFFSTDGVQFQKVPFNSVVGNNNAWDWSAGDLYGLNAKAVVLSNSANWLSNPISGTSVGFFTDKAAVRWDLGRRTETGVSLTYVAALGDTATTAQASPTLEPGSGWTIWRRLLIAGDQEKVIAGIAQARAVITDWGNG